MGSNQMRLNPEINQKPVRDHKKQSFWQIWFPLGLTIIVFILISVSASISSAANYELSLHWANVSALLLITPVLFVSLIFLVILVGLIVGLGKLLSIIPYYFGRAIKFFNQASGVVLVGANKVVAPVLSMRINSSKIKAIKSRLMSSINNQIG